MPDGKRKRRHSPNKAKQHWYAFSRAVRFARRFGGWQLNASPSAAVVAMQRA
jgi:hypothetical protein